MLVEVMHKAGFFDLCRFLFKKKRGVFLLLHGTYGKRFPNIPDALHFGMHVSELEGLIKWIKKERIPIRSTNEILEGKAGINFTFDDGYANNYDYALPVLEKMEVPFTLFVTTRHIISNKHSLVLDYFTSIIERTGAQPDEEIGYELFWGLKAEQLAAFSNHPLAEIGCHTHNHPHLDKCSDEVIVEEVETSCAIIKKFTGQRPRYFSYPFGDYDQRVLEIIQDNNFEASFAVNPRLANRKEFSSFQLPRIGIYQINQAYLSAKLNFLYRSIACE